MIRRLLKRVILWALASDVSETTNAAAELDRIAAELKK
jgi:hypothetical protein